MITVEALEQTEKDALKRQVFDLRVLVVGGGFQYTKMFYDAGFKGATSVEDADIVCFTGGEDVSPNLYGEEPMPGTYFSAKRDEAEALIYGYTLASQKPMIGICRGGQFLNVMNDGRMWQDVNNHCRGHSIIDMRTGEEKFDMTSTHHQMMIAGKGAEILAVAALATRKECQIDRVDRETPEADDMEVLWYPETLSLCFQPHPEFYPGSCRNYFLDLVDEYILPAT